MNGFDRFAGWLRRQKDSTNSFLIERALQRAIWDYGRMLNLNIDSRKKTVQCELLLKGETHPLTLVMQRYEIVTESAGTFIIIHEAAASREWVTTVLETCVRGKKIPIPEKYVKILRLIT
jgi:hypothetical protein